MKADDVFTAAGITNKIIETNTHVVQITGIPDAETFTFVAVAKKPMSCFKQGNFAHKPSVDSYGSLFAKTMDEAIAEVTQKWRNR